MSGSLESVGSVETGSLKGGAVLPLESPPEQAALKRRMLNRTGFIALLGCRQGTPHDKSYAMNAVRAFAITLERRRVVRALKARGSAPVDLGISTEKLRATLMERYEHRLSDFLNRLQREDLEVLTAKRRLETSGTVGELRARLWLCGATLEAGGDEHIGTAYQPSPIVLGSLLVHQGAVRGQCPSNCHWPRPVPEAVPEPAAPREPETLEELLGNADRLLGVRLGARGPDKGIYGTRIALLLGLEERGLAEADWRGMVEVKSVPVVRDRAGWWRVKEDPAIAMAQVDPRIKLRRVLWVARVGGPGDSPILSWYYQEWDHHVETLATRYLHHRPKGPKGTSNKGWYLQKRFFLYSGFLKSLNG